ncbi:hypothetical protein PPACK8108_LOCUS4069 [Phakopsora pachyrhizi]|uniref:Uncharacterized protein n=1 Tax=Phakopsora pachyrhizi TaxID=170000 RepID=A0AAV0AN26_PHAPC|nr:hypothetical protein PPACK8108_LOCUS4069 [Phakopsora pachyrhizi]
MTDNEQVLEGGDDLATVKMYHQVKGSFKLDWAGLAEEWAGLAGVVIWAGNQLIDYRQGWIAGLGWGIDQLIDYRSELGRIAGLVKAGFPQLIDYRSGQGRTGRAGLLDWDGLGRGIKQSN